MPCCCGRCRMPTRTALVTTRGSLAGYARPRAIEPVVRGDGDLGVQQYNLRIGDDTRQVLGGQVSRGICCRCWASSRCSAATSPRKTNGRTRSILGYGLWQSRFAGDPAVLGRTIDLSGTSYTVIGIAPAWFRFPTAEFQLWAPLSSIDIKSPQQAEEPRVPDLQRGGAAQAGRHAAAGAGGDARRRARGSRGSFRRPTRASISMSSPLYERLVGDVEAGADDPARDRRAAVADRLRERREPDARADDRPRAGDGDPRRARRGPRPARPAADDREPGACRGRRAARPARHDVGHRSAARRCSKRGCRAPTASAIDATVLAFSTCATLLTGVLFGLAPALQTATGPAGSLKESGRGMAGSGRGRRLRRAIVVIETRWRWWCWWAPGCSCAASSRLTARDAGFAPANLLSFNVQFVSLPDDASRVQAAAPLMDRLAELPGVEAAGAATGFPPVTPQRGTRFAVEGRTLTADRGRRVLHRRDARLLRGAAHAGAAGTGVRRPRHRRRPAGRRRDNRALASQLFPGQDAVGHRLKLINPEQSARLADDRRRRRRREISRARTRNSSRPSTRLSRRRRSCGCT